MNFKDLANGLHKVGLWMSAVNLASFSTKRGRQSRRQSGTVATLLVVCDGRRSDLPGLWCDKRRAKDREETEDEGGREDRSAEGGGSSDGVRDRVQQCCRCE